MVDNTFQFIPPWALFLSPRILLSSVPESFFKIFCGLLLLLLKESFPDTTALQPLAPLSRKNCSVPQQARRTGGWRTDQSVTQRLCLGNGTWTSCGYLFSIKLYTLPSGKPNLF
ncbi:hypothetical protein CapIbe_018497 [Capra ibex]